MNSHGALTCLETWKGQECVVRDQRFLVFWEIRDPFCDMRHQGTVLRKIIDVN